MAVGCFRRAHGLDLSSHTLHCLTPPARHRKSVPCLSGRRRRVERRSGSDLLRSTHMTIQRGVLPDQTSRCEHWLDDLRQDGSMFAGSSWSSLVCTRIGNRRVAQQSLVFIRALFDPNQQEHGRQHASLVMTPDPWRWASCAKPSLTCSVGTTRSDLNETSCHNGSGGSRRTGRSVPESA